VTLELDELNSGDNVNAPPVPPRHCGRCQCAFPGDPTLFFQTDWALCPACKEILLPRGPVSPTPRPLRDEIPYQTILDR
jgi:hypothetical protein